MELCARVYDHRNLGASDGERRQEIDPQARSATTGTRSRSPHAGRGRRRADRGWGSKLNGAHDVVVGAIDRRVRCVVAQVPLISGHENVRR